MNKPHSPESFYIPVEQVAARFSVSVDTIWRWCRKGAFPKPYHPGGSAARWKVADIEAYEATLEAGFITEIDLCQSGFFEASHPLAEVA